MTRNRMLEVEERLPDGYMTIPIFVDWLPRGMLQLTIMLSILGIYCWPGKKRIPVVFICCTSLAIVSLFYAGIVLGLVFLVLHFTGVL